MIQGIKSLYDYVMTFIASLFALAVASGLIDKFTGMFVVLFILAFTVFITKLIILAIDKEELFKDKSRIDILTKLSFPVIELCSVIIIFLVLAASTVFTLSIDSMFHYFFYVATWLYTAVITSNYLTQVLHFGKRIGIPGMKSVIEGVEDLKKIFLKRGKK